MKTILFTVVKYDATLRIQSNTAMVRCFGAMTDSTWVTGSTIICMGSAIYETAMGPFIRATLEME